MNISNIPIRVHENEKKRLEAVAKRRGVTLAELMRRGVAIAAGFDDDFSAQLAKLCNRLQLPEAVVIQNIVTNWMAQKDAEMDLFPGRGELLPEFTFSTAGPLPSGILYGNMKARHLDTLEGNRARFIEMRKELGRATAHELEWLEQYDHKQAQLNRQRDEATLAMADGRMGVLSGDELARTDNDIEKRRSE